MKAMILAAGIGSRMRPLTLTTPKPLLMVGGKPLIVWHIEALRDVGVREIVINAAYLKQVLVDTLKDGSQYGVNISWSLEDEGLETAGGIIQALPLLGEQPFLVVNGDIWTPFPMERLVGQAKQMQQSTENLAHVVLVRNPEHHPTGDFYLVGGRVFENEAAASIDQSIAKGEALTFAGLSVLSPQMFAGLEAGKRPLAPLLRQAMQRRQVSGEKMSCEWVDVGTPERLQQLDQALLA